MPLPLSATTPGAGLFASGGYTGNGAANQAAGIVHGGEYVFSKKATSRIGVGNLEAMHNRAKGYASGGYDRIQDRNKQAAKAEAIKS